MLNIRAFALAQPFVLAPAGGGKDVLSAGNAFFAEAINIFAGGRMVGVFVVV